MSGHAFTAHGQLRRRRMVAALTGALLLVSCSPTEAPPAPVSDSGWREFTGTLTASGKRHVLDLGAGRRASIGNLDGALLLEGAGRPGVGFRTEAIVFNDSATGMTGRAVWTDENGDSAFSEMKGEGSATGNRITGTFTGGTGRYAGVTGGYEFSWRFVLESEDGTVQGQSSGLKGKALLGGAAGAPR